MALDELERQRLAKLERLVAKGIDPYPARVQYSHTTAAAAKAFEEIEAAGTPLEVGVVGRLRSLREMGKAAFAHIEDGTGKLQLYVRMDELGPESFQTFTKDLDLGDFVEAHGTMFRTKTGEVSVRVKTWRLLAKAISPLPVIKEQMVDGQLVRYSAFSDVEERYRQRYADLASNPEVREVFRVRARLITALRRFLDGKGFLEVETPILQPVYGGAAARPFMTHHNQLDQDLYLRISFELYLKRLLVGMYDRVYEIGHDFRNEGISFKHNPEFTQLEFYMAYADYHDVMALTEEMFATAAREVLGRTQVTYKGNQIELAGPWHRVTLRDAIKQFAEIDYVEYPDAPSLRAAIREMGGHAPEDATWGKLVDGLLGDYVEPHLVQPTFVTDYPRDISPLAKRKPGDATHVERFEFFIGGMELGNAFSELNDPLDQEERFKEMARLYAPEDDEAHPIDEDYLRAMRYGMPPCGGFGTGVDRIAMLFTDRDSIREVILFPHLKT